MFSSVLFWIFEHRWRDVCEMLKLFFVNESFRISSATFLDSFYDFFLFFEDLF